MQNQIIFFNTYFKKLTGSQGRTAKAGRQVMYSFLLKGFSILTGFIYVPLLLNYLTQEKYGIWLTLTSILGWFGFFDIGLGNGLRNKLTESFALGDMNLGKKYVSTTYALLICIFSVVLVIFNVCNVFVDWQKVLNTKTISNQELYVLTSIVFTFFIIRFIVQLIGVIYLADHKPSVNNALGTASNLLSLIIVYILTKSAIKGDLVLLGSIITIMPVLLFVFISIYAFKNNYANIKPSFKAINFKLSSGLMSLGVKFFLMQVSAIVIFSTSSIFIAQFYGPKEVVVYNIVFKYFQMPVMIFSIILSPFWSAVTDALVKNDYAWLKSSIRRLNIMSALFSLGIIIMVFISRPVFKIWVGDKVNPPFSLVVFMAIYSIINVFLSPFVSFINGTGKIKLTMSFTFVEMVLYFGSIFFFAHVFKNSSGIVVAIIITSSVGSIVQPIQTYKILNKKATGIWFK
jgi:O-antigen/teichoic acid export membrane protein